MRLLRYSEDGEFSLTEDYIDNVPPYAILSHRWGKDSEEVAFRDIKDRTGKSKIGYEKIRFCARQAACDNLAFFWVDTCCIDKSSSFELQEAINSMFDWYKKADKCYVYLRDVSLRELQASEQVSEYSWEHYFRRSEWFTRGWTLQELLAPGPESMEFFSREGERLGTKKDLEQEIHDITEIPLAALRGTALSQFDVEQRLSWAKGRQTTRGEDKAYSLFGIFDVQLPFLPGEGEEKALKRLQKEIDKPLKKELAQKKRVMSWLSNTPYEKHHRHNSKSRSEGSGEWLLQTTKFKNWKTRPESDILWLRGLPGSGKTLLASRVVDSILLENETTQGSTQLAYFYCSRTSDDTKRGDPSNVLRSIARQLAQSRESAPLAYPIVVHRYEEIIGSDQERELEIDETIDLIIKLKDINSATIVIDGLDECSSQDGKRGLFFQGLKTIASSPGKTVKIFVTSREDNDIRGAFLDYPYHWIDAQDNKADIQKYVDEELEKAIQRRSNTSGRRISTRLAMKIQRELVDKAGGIFRWVGLQLQALFDMNVNKLEGDMEHQLLKLPPGLEAS